MIHIDALLEEPTANKEYSEQVLWLVRIFEWLRLAKDLDNHRIPRDRVYSVRIKYLLHLLSRNPKWKQNFIATVSELLKKMSSANLFTDVGMSLNHSFIQELFKRIEDKLLPQTVLAESLSGLMLEIFPSEEESILFDGIEASVFKDVLDLFSEDPHLAENLTKSMRLSIYALASQLLANAFTIHREIEGGITDSKSWPESKLLEASINNSSSEEMLLMLNACENLRQRNYELIQSRGIKVDFVFLLESQKRRIDRISALLTLTDNNKPKTLAIRLFIANLILDIHRQKSLISFFSENLNLLTQRIVSRNSDVGEHYITFNWPEFRKMYQSAVGGGAVTSFTVFAKILISKMGLPGFINGLAESLNYAASFLAIQGLGYTLATKQPSATAPYLAQSLKKSVTESRKAMIAILRTQFIAVIGNLTLVTPICFLVSWLLLYLGYPIISSQKSSEVFSSTNFLGPSVLFATFTGFLLFLSSLIAGWFDNWVVVHKLPDRIVHNQKFTKFLGKKWTQRISVGLKKNANIIAANISLGFLLGLTPKYLNFVGIPLEVRHVTLATGGFAVSLPSMLNQGIQLFDLINSVFGLLIIGVLNISVSFSLALILAAISSKIKLLNLWGLAKWGILVILTKPWLLFVPEKKD